MFSEREKGIIMDFYRKLDDIENKELRLSWDTGFVIAKFDTCFEDFDDDNEDDEFTSFIFEVVRKEGEVPLEISSANLFIVNYHNFPKKIDVLS